MVKLLNVTSTSQSGVAKSYNCSFRDVADLDDVSYRFAWSPESLAIYLVEEHESPPVLDIGIVPIVRFPNDILHPRAIVFQTTHECNLRCHYCFIDGYYSDRDCWLTFDVAKRALDQFLPPKGDINIGFFGGEPLLNWKVIVDIVHYVKSLPNIRPSFSITTNGTIYKPEIIQFLAEHKFSIITSLDGPKNLHDKYRVDRNGHGSFDKVMEWLNAIKNHEVLVNKNTLRSTYTADVESLVEPLEFLNQLCDDGYASWVSVEPCELSESQCVYQESLRLRDEHLPKLRRLYLEAVKWWIDRANSGKIPRFHQINKLLERVLYRQHALTECGAGVGYIGINGRGEIFACHREAGTKIGDLENGVDEFLRAPWIDNRVYARQGCRQCSIRYVCGGGCRQTSVVETGNIHMPAPIYCKIKQIWFDCVLLILMKCNPERLMQIIRRPQHRWQQK